jgi:hypothetical protein
MPPKNPSHLDYIFFIYATLTFNFFVRDSFQQRQLIMINISSTIENTTNHCFKSLLNLANIKKKSFNEDIKCENSVTAVPIILFS